MSLFEKALQNKKESKYYFFRIIILVSLFYISIHPVTGFVGGLIMYLVGWAIPTILILFLSFWLIRFFKVSLRAKKYIFFLLTIILGINNNLPILIRSIISPIPTYTKNIKENSQYKKNIYLQILDPSDGEIYIPSNPLVSPFYLGGDEGCMCMYFLKRESYSERLSRVSLNNKRYFDHSDYYNRLQFKITKNSENSAKCEVELIQGNEKALLFKIERIPYRKIKGRYGRDLKLLNGYFYSNVTDMLLHNNIWNHTIGFFIPFSKISNYFYFRKITK